MFQSTHPQRVRHAYAEYVWFFIPGFNPRTHKGCDTEFSTCQQLQKVSIHAPTKGAT